MKMKLLIVFSGSMLALTACNKHDEVTTNAADSNVMIDNGTVANTAEAGLTSQGFANAAAASDRFEIESSKLAASAGTSAAVKSFASKMVTAHTASTAKLKTTAADLNLTPDDALSPEQQQTLDSLKALNGAEFDSAYAAAQVEAHLKALDALNGYAAAGDNQKLKDLASGMVPTVTAHLNMAKGLK